MNYLPHEHEMTYTRDQMRETLSYMHRTGADQQAVEAKNAMLCRAVSTIGRGTAQNAVRVAIVDQQNTAVHTANIYLERDGREEAARIWEEFYRLNPKLAELERTGCAAFMLVSEW